jgi:hypothetical protein
MNKIGGALNGSMQHKSEHGSKEEVSVMNLENVGVVIASRELMLDGDQKVEVLIGKPERCPDGVDWYCPYQKYGVGLEHVKSATGADSVSALVRALTMVGAELYCSNEYQDGRLTWDCGAVKGDLGFPVAESIRDVLPNNPGGNRVGESDDTRVPRPRPATRF